jgi:hypothetical protein
MSFQKWKFIGYLIQDGKVKTWRTREMERVFIFTLINENEK